MSIELTEEDILLLILETELIKLLFVILKPRNKLVFVTLILIVKLLSLLAQILCGNFILFVKFEKPLTILSKSVVNASSLWIVALVSVNIETKETALAFKAFLVDSFKLLILVARSDELTFVSSRALIPIIELLTSLEFAFKFNSWFIAIISYHLHLIVHYW